MKQANDFSYWKYYQYKGENVGISITHPNGKYEARLLIDIEVQNWLSEGNEPIPADGEQA